MAGPADTALQEPEGSSEDWRVLFFREPCTRLEGSGCSRCATVCPAGAISFAQGRAGGDAPAIDDGACTRCGICIGICDSFAASSILTVDYAKRVVRRARATGKAYLCCREDLFEGLEPAGNVFAFGCLSALSPEFLAYLLSSGIDVVLCHDIGYCEGCAAGGRFGARLWRRAFALAQAWTGRQASVADAIPEVEHLSDKLAAPDRRTLFTGAIGALGEVASGEYRARKSTVVDDFLVRREQMRARMRARHGDEAFLDDDSRSQAMRSRFARRILIEEAKRNDPGIAARMEGPA